MVILECCPPFQWRLKYRRFGPGHWRVMWAWFAVAYMHYGLPEYVKKIADAAVELDREKPAKD
jgi:hypothetical protein